MYVLHLREYRETSLIAEVYSGDSGRLSVIFKGIRSRKSRYSGMVQPFVPISLSLFGRSDLKTVANLEFPEKTVFYYGQEPYFRNVCERAVIQITRKI